MRSVGVFDTETTGVDPETARIVSAFVGVLDERGELVEARSWLVDPGVEIPEGATAVHGITTERARAEGQRSDTAALAIEEAIVRMFANDLPVVIMNAPYDLTVLDRELWRGNLRGLSITPIPIVDPMVLDRAMDKYRPGGRKLQDLARHYFGPERFENTDWHGAQADAVTAGQIAQLLLEDYRLADAPLSDIHKWQVTWKRRQAESFREYLANNGKPTEDVRVEWPILPKGPSNAD